MQKDYIIMNERTNLFSCVSKNIVLLLQINEHI